MMNIKCEICGVIFYVFPSAIKHGRKYCSVKCRNKALSLSRKGKNNPAWIGNKIGYKGVHVWLQRNFKKPLKCAKCECETKLDWANISGKYKRDIKDWEVLCRKCHMISDNRMNNRDLKGKFCGYEIEMND